MRTFFSVIILLGLAAGGTAYYVTHFSGDTLTQYRTATVERGDLMATIDATGTVVAEEFVDIGAQIAGRIKCFGIEPSELKGRNYEDIDPEEREKLKHIDFNSVVHPGTLLALIDDAVYKAHVAQAEAALQRAVADLEQLEAKLDQAKREWQRAKELQPENAIADSDYDLAVADYKAAKANMAIGHAAIKQSEAELDLAKTNLGYTIIRSPVEGVIVARRVNVGQTVVAGLNAPSLFLIAKDLRKMQVWASVSEVDIGRIYPGMPVRFTVDASPNQVFLGKVLQVRLDAATTQNVITYTVVVETDNSDGKLLPYLTANLNFITDECSDILKVPNAALRWKPEWEQIAPSSRNDPLLVADANAREAKGDDTDHVPYEERSFLWVADDHGFVRPIMIHTGVTDGLMTEVNGPNLKEGMKVVTGVAHGDEVESGATNLPFIPKMPRHKRRR